MSLKLDAPVCIFDLETTGINPVHDRIVEISILRIEPGGAETLYTRRVNPGMPIPEKASAVHGITNEDVKDAPTFEEIAGEVYELIKDAYLIGFNSNRFDLPVLVEELLRAGMEITLKENKTIDVQTIYHKKEPRTLSAAYKFYTGKDLEDAHSAEADVKATWEILKAQVDKYGDIPTDLDGLATYSTHNKHADFQGRIIYDEQGREVINFGKYKGRLLEEVFEKDPGYYGWLMQADFPLYTKLVFKNVFERIKLKQLRKKFNG